MTEPLALVMSVETTPGHSYKTRFGSTTTEDGARAICENTYHGRRESKLPVVTVALMREGKIVDVYHGDSWQSGLDAKLKRRNRRT